MTIVGKILVFLNLVFSLIVGGMVMVVYMTRTNWEDGFKKKDALLNAVVADRDQTSRELESVRKDYEDKLTKMTADRDAQITARDNVRKELNAKEAELLAIKQQQKGQNATAETTIAASDARREQVRLLTEDNEKLRDANRTVIKEKLDERRARIQADVEAKTYRARNLELESQLRDMAREILRVQAGPTGAVVTRKKGEENPPLDNVEGRVVLADEDNLVKLSIGSDAGLVPGHTLKVFRLDPIPERSRYLGVIEILSVRPNEAVGRPLKPMPLAMRPGDRVAARLGN